MTLPNTQIKQTVTVDAKPSRRGFFMGAAAVGAGVASYAALHPESIPTVSAAQSVAPTGGGGYSLSAHVKRYYQTTMI